MYGLEERNFIVCPECDAGGEGRGGGGWHLTSKNYRYLLIINTMPIYNIHLKLGIRLGIKALLKVRPTLKDIQYLIFQIQNFLFRYVIIM